MMLDRWNVPSARISYPPVPTPSHVPLRRPLEISSTLEGRTVSSPPCAKSVFPYGFGPIR